MSSPEAARTAADETVDAYLDSSDTPVGRRLDRRMLAFAGLGLGIYLLTLLLTIPASLIVPLPGAGGTIWRGSAPLGGGAIVAWRWSPLGSIGRLGFAADFGVAGGDNSLTGQAILHPGRLLVQDVRGSADGALLTAVAQPSFTCTLTMKVDMPRIAIGGGARALLGRIDSQPGDCRPLAGGPPVATPALRFDAVAADEGSQLILAPAAQPQTAFLAGTLAADGALRLRVTGEGATALPFLSPPGGMAIETEL